MNALLCPLPLAAYRLAGYELHDLVSLDNQTFGVIVGVEKEACRVLTNQGRPEKPDVRVCRLPDIQRKLLSKRNVTQDAGGCQDGCARGGGRVAGGAPLYVLGRLGECLLGCGLGWVR